MAKGENIFRRRDGRWEARYSKGRELSGKIKYGYCYGKTYREAKEKAEKCKAALANGNPLPTSRIQNLFSAYCIERNRSASFPICKAIWIHADSASCWRYVQASELVSSARYVGNMFLQEIKQSKLQRRCKSCVTPA